ncbi:MAG TPA: MarR family transcriptional regulator [Streptosporangiaceae bacterium]
MADTHDGIRGSSEVLSGAALPARAADTRPGGAADIGADSGPGGAADTAADTSPRGAADIRRGGAADTAPGDRDPAAVRAFIESFTSQLTQAGFPRTPARIFVALLTSDSSRLTAAELGELLQTSPASVSGGVRYLTQVGLVTAEGEPGSRRQHYRMPTDVWEDIVRLRDRQFARWVTELQEGVAALGADSPAGARMAETVRYFEFLSADMSSMLARWREHAASTESATSRPDH